MGVTIHTLAPPWPRAHRALASPVGRFVLAGVVVLALLAALSALNGAPGTLFWSRAQLTFAAAFAAAGATVSVRGTRGRTRAVRVWLAIAIAFWLASELVRDVELLEGASSSIGLSDLLFVGVLICAGGAYVTTLRGKVRGREEAAVYLDAAVLFLTCASLMLTVFGDIAARSVMGAVDLLYAIFFMATVGATLLLDLAVRAERRLHGAYLLLVGLVLLGIGFLWKLVAPADGFHELGVPSHLMTFGVVVVMLGTMTWTDAVDRHPGYVRFADQLRRLLPVGAVGLASLLMLAHIVRDPGGPIGLLTGISTALLLPLVTVRQTVLLADREHGFARQRQLASDLSAAERQYRALVETQPGVVYLAEPGASGRWHYVSPQVEQMLGFPAQTWLDDPTLWSRQLHPDDRRKVLDAEDAVRLATAGGTSRSEYRLRAADGRDVWVLQDEAVTRHGPDGRPSMMQGVLLDITERKESEDALRASEEQTRTIIETASHAFVGMDTDGSVIDWNQRAVDTFGWEAGEAIGRDLADLVIPEAQRERHRAGLRHYLETGEGPLLSKRVEVTALHRDGREFPVELTIWPVTLRGVVRFNAIVDDITVRKQLEDQLRHQALHDSLTGLPNRVLFSDRVKHAGDRGEIAVLFLDLDDFKTINDSLGHAVGDDLLAAVAERLTGVLRAEDTAARLGGDEFAVLLEDATSQHPSDVAARILNAMTEPFELGGKVVSTTASMGMVMSGTDGGTTDELLRNADLAMYLAKTRGKNRFELYVPGMHERALRRHDLKAALERAIAADELEVQYQPIVSLEDGSVTGLEALLRWRGTDGQHVPLDEVIPLAEETGLIIPIGRTVLARAMQDMRAWQQEVGPGRQLDLAVNVSVLQLEQGSVVEDVERALEASGISPASLVLEITEGSLTNDSLDTVRSLRDLRARGIRLALDDFGTGYSSLERLRRFAVDIVKIDRSFVTAITQDREGVLVQSIIDLGRSLGMEVVAEGVETPAHVRALRARGVVYGQGYYYSRAVSADGVRALLAGGRLPRRRRRSETELARGA